MMEFANPESGFMEEQRMSEHKRREAGAIMSERQPVRRDSKVHTAYHEIGHALAAHVLRCQFNSVGRLAAG